MYSLDLVHLIPSWLSWAEIKRMVYVALPKRPKNCFKTVQQSRQQVLRAFTVLIYKLRLDLSAHFRKLAFILFQCYCFPSYICARLTTMVVHSSRFRYFLFYHFTFIFLIKQNSFLLSWNTTQIISNIWHWFPYLVDGRISKV